MAVGIDVSGSLSHSCVVSHFVPPQLLSISDIGLREVHSHHFAIWRNGDYTPAVIEVANIGNLQIGLVVLVISEARARMLLCVFVHQTAGRVILRALDQHAKVKFVHFPSFPPPALAGGLTKIFVCDIMCLQVGK